MKDNFFTSLKNVLKSEGGYVNNPHDPGGATNKGITQEVYDDWRVAQALPKRSVKLINGFETGKIYQNEYWHSVRGDDLPMGLDYCMFDFAVNSGASRAIRYLQRVLGVYTDGQLGPVTMDKLAHQDIKGVIKGVCLARLEFLKNLKTWDVFGHGWKDRVDWVLEQAEAMVDSPTVPHDPTAKFDRNAI